jgi:hypothetical protein
VFENNILRGIFGPKRDEVTGEWGKLHNGELRDLYSSLVFGLTLTTGFLTCGEFAVCHLQLAS